MGIKAKFSNADIRKEIERQWAIIESAIFQIMAYVGEEFISNARSGLNIESGAFPKGDYTDQTANLRGSLAYFILKDGKIVQKNLSGSTEGQSAAQSVLSDVPKIANGYHLVGVAGMDYASSLEAMGYNVISSQSDLALVDLSKKLKAYASKKGFDMNVDFTGVMVQMR